MEYPDGDRTLHALLEDPRNQSISSVLTAIEKVRAHCVHGRRSGEQLREQSGGRQCRNRWSIASRMHSTVLLRRYCCRIAVVREVVWCAQEPMRSNSRLLLLLLLGARCMCSEMCVGMPGRRSLHCTYYTVPFRLCGCVDYSSLV